MPFLLIGLLIFIAIHSLPIVPQLRAELVARLGLLSYRLMHSLGAVLGVGLMAYGFALYRASGLLPLWAPPIALRHITLLLMLFAFVFMAAAFGPQGYIKKRLKHPMIIAVKTWALAHLLANGDVGGMVLFGVFLIWAVVDMISFRWRPVPAAAPAAPQLKWDGAVLALGLIGYGAMIHLHPLVIGVAVMG